MDILPIKYKLLNEIETVNIFLIAPVSAKPKYINGVLWFLNLEGIIVVDYR